MFSVVFFCDFIEPCSYCGIDYDTGDQCFFSVVLSADSFSIAVDKALTYLCDYFSTADCSIYSITRLSSNVIDMLKA